MGLKNNTIIIQTGRGESKMYIWSKVGFKKDLC